MEACTQSPTCTHTNNPGLHRDRQAAGAGCSLLPPFPLISLLLSPLLPLGGSGNSQELQLPLATSSQGSSLVSPWAQSSWGLGMRFQFGSMEPCDSTACEPWPAWSDLLIPAGTEHTVGAQSDSGPAEAHSKGSERFMTRAEHRVGA